MQQKLENLDHKVWIIDIEKTVKNKLPYFSEFLTLFLTLCDPGISRYSIYIFNLLRNLTTVSTSKWYISKANDYSK